MPKKKIYLALILILFGLIYAAISLVNHYYFRTYALDLGAYTNALFDYAHFQWNDSKVFKTEAENLLADHFDLYLILLAPLSYLFGTATLLIVQIAALLFGAIGVFRYFELEYKTKQFSIPAATFFLAFFGVMAAVAFDYHSSVVASCFVPWFFTSVKKEQFALSAIWLLIMAISKENFAFWLAFLASGLAWEMRANKRVRNFLLFAAIGCLIYFYAAISWIMPAISNAGDYHHFHFSALGSNVGEAFIQLISHPIDSLKILATNHTGAEHGDFVKAEFMIIALLSGGFFLVFKPQYLWMLIPIFFQKLFHDNDSMWGIAFHYSIELAPIYAIGIFSAIADFQNLKLQKVATYSAIVLGLATTIRTMDHTEMYTNKSKIRIYKASHYKRDFDVQKAHELLDQIPAKAVFSAQSPFLPHLALRDKIYQFPNIEDAEFIVFSMHELSYPLTEENFKSLTDSLTEDTNWQVISNEPIFILKRK